MRKSGWVDQEVGVEGGGGVDEGGMGGKGWNGMDEVDGIAGDRNLVDC